MEQQNSALRVYTDLEEAILLGRLKPRERLVERDLVDQFGVSRTPVREAIGRLRSAGLVEPAGRRGVVVRDFTRKEVLDLYYLRETLERAAAKLICENITPQDIKEADKINRDFGKACNVADLRAMIEANNAFHQRLLETTRNNFLIEDLEQVRLKVFVFRYSLWADPKAAKVSIRDHDKMLKALKSGNRQKFEHTVLRHMNVARDAYLAQNFWGRE